LLEVKGLSARYGGAIDSLREVDIRVDEGESVAVLGSNGAGKSSLLRAISGVLALHGGEVTSGSVLWRGTDISRSTPQRRVRLGIAQSPEGRGIFPGLTVEENLRAGAITRPRKELPASLDECYELFPDLLGKRTTKGGLLSGGQQQMLALARALISKPSLLLLDEPSLGLAPLAVDRVGVMVRKINATGTAVLLVEQNVRLALSLASRAYVLEVGTVQLSGDADTLATNDQIQQLYLGISRSSPVTRSQDD